MDKPSTLWLSWLSQFLEQVVTALQHACSLIRHCVLQRRTAEQLVETQLFWNDTTQGQSNGECLPQCRTVGPSVQIRNKWPVAVNMASHLQVLGGRVEELYEAWEFQRKYGDGAARPAADAAGAPDSERPPPFQTYVPGKTRAPRRPAAVPGLAGPDVHGVPAAPAAVAAQRDGGAASGRPPGIAPPPGFNLIPDRLRFERNAAPAAVRGPSSDPVSARQGELGLLGGAAAAEALPSRAGPSAAAKAKLQERLAASEEVRPC